MIGLMPNIYSNFELTVFELTVPDLYYKNVYLSLNLKLVLYISNLQSTFSFSLKLFSNNSFGKFWDKVYWPFCDCTDMLDFVKMM